MTVHILTDEAPVVTTQLAIPAASDASLLATIAAFDTLRDIPDNAQRAVLERRAAYAIMMAEEERNHKGWPKGAPPPDLTFVGLVRNLCEVTARHAPRATGLRATGVGTSTLQPGSARCAVLKWIAAQPGATATAAAVNSHFNKPCHGHIQKLLAVAHLEQT